MKKQNKQQKIQKHTHTITLAIELDFTPATATHKAEADDFIEELIEDLETGELQNFWGFKINRYRHTIRRI